MKKIIITVMLILILTIPVTYSSFSTGQEKSEDSLVANMNLKSEEVDLSRPEKDNNIHMNLTLKQSKISTEERIINDFHSYVDSQQGISLASVQAKNNDTLVDKIKKHTVTKGETLWVIAQKHDINIDTLIGANNISDMNKIKPGEKISILPVKGILYKIGPGESLSSIANKFNIRVQKIANSNQIKNPNKVKPGRLLILPGAKPEFSYRDRLERLFVKPVNSRISSYYGKRWGRMHEGIDYAVNVGTKLKAAGAGKVVYSGWAQGYGKTIIIEHQKGLRTLYAHNSKLIAHSGEWVRRGEIISNSGNTGNSTGPHLHFEVQVNGRPVNPLNYLRK
jgi:murein DD-endopeptidase MepM/ murein hydrolase activator NlpD